MIATSIYKKYPSVFDLFTQMYYPEKPHEIVLKVIEDRYKLPFPILFMMFKHMFEKHGIKIRIQSNEEYSYKIIIRQGDQDNEFIGVPTPQESEDEIMSTILLKACEILEMKINKP